MPYLGRFWTEKLMNFNPLSIKTDQRDQFQFEKDKVCRKEQSPLFTSEFKKWTGPLFGPTTVIRSVDSKYLLEIVFYALIGPNLSEKS